MFSKECVETFLKNQLQLFDEKVVENEKEAEQNKLPKFVGRQTEHFRRS